MGGVTRSRQAVRTVRTASGAPVHRPPASRLNPVYLAALGVTMATEAGPMGSIPCVVYKAGCLESGFTHF